MENLLASSSNSSGNNNSAYEIFINHRGPDTKLSIAGHLYSCLTQHGLRVFLDKEEMEKGDFLTSQIAAAIRDASVQIAIFSPRYAESEWCLNELLLMLESMESGHSTIIPIFHRVQPADLRWTLGKDGVYAKALNELQEKKTADSQTKRYKSDTIEKWRNALSNVSHISGFDLVEAYSGVEWQLVNDVVEKVLEKVKKPPLDVSRYPTGLDQKVKEFEELLEQQSGRIRVVGIVGLGGVGKTTLSKEIFNRLRSNYKQSCFLFDVREKSRNSLHSLQSILIKDLTGSNVQISSADDGQEKLRRYLSSSQALIILDDVDHIQQLERLLLPAKDVLDTRSLILVTSRNKDVLINSDIPESSIYRLTGLDPQHSQELFCNHAFGQPQPVVGFDKVVIKFLDACNGLPLSLKVLGALLRGQKDLKHWEAQLRKMSKILPDDIQSTLKISYDSLDPEEKQIFLDIACFFIGQDMDTGIRVWDESGWEGSLGLRNLQNKCLVEVGQIIIMHDHLRDLGRHIGKKESPHRLWSLTDNILDDLPEKFKVRGINMVETSVDNREELGNRFLGMHGLQLIRAQGDCLDETIFTSVKSHHLIWLRWDSCPWSCLPRWIPTEHLRFLQVEDSNTLEALWEENNLQALTQQSRELNIIDIGLSEIPMSLRDEFCHLESLKQLSLSGCRSLKSLPDSFGKLRNLQHIDLSFCVSFERLPDSFGELKNLQHFKFCLAKSFERLPDSFGQLKNLQHFVLTLCHKLERLPDSFGELKNLQKFYLFLGHKLERLPDSFGELNSLQHIFLSHCFKLERLPDSFGELNNLRDFNLSSCERLERLPDSFGELKNLQNINLSSCLKLERLPDSFGGLKNLRHIDLSYCPKLERLPDSFGELKNLRQIDLSYCPKLERLPYSLCNFTQLQHLALRGCDNLNISPKTFGEISTLKYLDLSLCPKIKGLPPQLAHNRLLLKLFLSGTNSKELPSDIGELSNLQVLDLGSEWLEILPPSLCHLRGLQELVLSHCGRLKCLPDNIAYLSSLQKLKLSGCTQLKCLPDSIRLLSQLIDFNINDSGVEYLPPSVVELNRLEQLQIRDCPLSQLPFRIIEGGRVGNKLDASVVGCMLQLRYLNLFGLEISEVSFSEGVCPNLQHLGIDRCNFLAEVGALPRKVIKLTLSECCALRKIGGLCGLEKLEKIKLVECHKLKELPGLETLKCLDELVVNCQNLKIVEGLAQLTRLQVLNLENCCELREIPEFEQLKSLRKLNARGCGKLQSIGGLAQLTGLQELKMENCCDLEEISGLEFLKSLRELNASGCGKLQRIKGLPQLTGLQELNVANCCELEEIDLGLEHLKSLEKLNASGCGKLQSIEGLAQLTGLQVLNIANCCDLEEISGLEFLKSLTELDVSGCGKLQSIEGLPQFTGIQVLRNLQVLILGSEWLEILPPSLGHLRGLQELVLSNCGRLKYLPDNIGYLNSLKKLKLSGCTQLKCLPDSIILLTQLRDLKINKSGLEYLPPCVMELNSLERLEIKDCPLSQLPFRKVERGLVWKKQLDASIVECMIQLKYLNLFCIVISEVSFPEGVCPNLQHLDISRCGFLAGIGALPTTLIKLTLRECCALRKIGGLCGLQKLEKIELVDCHKLKELPGLETLICLGELIVNCHNLKRMERLVQLTQLQVLDLENCSELREIPGFEQLKSLRNLNASGCGKLQSIEGLAQLTGLQELNMENCCNLEEISGLEFLKSLRKLNASGCGKLQRIKGLPQLTGLQELNVANCCELEEIDLGLEHLKSLEELNASGCGKLQSIQGLAQLRGLQVLNMANCCDLEEISGLEHLKSLKKLNVSGCGKLQSIEGLPQLTGLQVLNLAYCCQLEETDLGLEHLKSLEELNANGWGKPEGIKGLAQLTGLQVLNVVNCCKLEEIPGLEYLKSLIELNVSGRGKLHRGLQHLKIPLTVHGWGKLQRT